MLEQTWRPVARHGAGRQSWVRELPKNPTISPTVRRWSDGRSTSVKETWKGCRALLSLGAARVCLRKPRPAFQVPFLHKKVQNHKYIGGINFAVAKFRPQPWSFQRNKQQVMWSCFQLPVRRPTAAFWSSQEREARLTLMFRALQRSSRELVKAWLAFLRKPSFLMLRTSEHDTVTALARWERCQNKEFGRSLSSNALYYIHISIWLSTSMFIKGKWWTDNHRLPSCLAILHLGLFLFDHVTTVGWCVPAGGRSDAAWGSRWWPRPVEPRRAETSSLWGRWWTPPELYPPWKEARHRKQIRTCLCDTCSPKTLRVDIWFRCWTGIK